MKHQLSRLREAFGYSIGSKINKPPQPPLSSPASAVSHKTTDFIVSRNLRQNERFIQFLLFGMMFSNDVAREQSRWLKQCLRDWQPQDPDWTGMAQSEQNRFIYDLMNQIVLDAMPQSKPSRPITLGLSGGYDSRPLLHILRQQSLPVATFTYGQRGNLDFDLSKSLSSDLAIDTVFFDTSEVEWRLELFDQDALRTQDLPISPRVIAAEHMNRMHPNRLELHGFANGVVTGSHRKNNQSDDWAVAINEFATSSDFFKLQQLVDVEPSEFLPQRPLLDPELVSAIDQLDITLKQKQRIRLLRPSDSGQYAFVYEDPRWCGFWLSRSSEERLHQIRYIDFLRSLNAPEFFDLAVCKESNRSLLRKQRLELFYGSQYGPPIVDLGQSNKAIPTGQTAHFCFFACYANNGTFRTMIRQSLRRLKSRNVFASTVIDDILARFENGQKGANSMLNGLVSCDVALEANRFS